MKKCDIYGAVVDELETLDGYMQTVEIKEACELCVSVFEKELNKVESYLEDVLMNMKVRFFKDFITRMRLRYDTYKLI